jgi:restriction endonuclease Mrr
VTESFVWKTKYFYDESNLEEFRDMYDEMPFYRKILENKLLTGGVLIGTALLVLVVILGLLGAV